MILWKHGTIYFVGHSKVKRGVILGFEFDFLYFLQTLHTPWLDKFLSLVTSLGDSGWFWLALGITFTVFKKTRKVGFIMLLAIFLGFLVSNVALKNIFLRQRPCWIDPSVPLLIDVPRDYSFPSGHATASFAGAMGIYLNRRGWGIGALVLAAVIAFSRLYLFVHFPSDVLVGTLIGIGSAVLANFGVRKFLDR